MTKRDGLVFLHGSHTPGCIASVDKTFSYYTLQLMTKGSVAARYDTDTYTMQGPWVWPAWPGPHIRFHEYPRGVPWDHRYIAFEGPLAATWMAEGLIPTRPLPIESSRDSDRLAQLFDELLTDSTRTDSLGRWRGINTLEKLLIEITEIGMPNHTPPPEWLLELLQSLQRWDRNPDYKQLAKDAGMSLSTLRRQFREATGVSIHTFRLQARIAKARNLLGESEDPIKHIAQALGYRDVYYFTRQFSQFVGVSPSKYRQTRQ